MSSDVSFTTPAVTAELEYPCGTPPVHGAVREVAPGVLWLRMAMPIVLDHINLWVVREGDGWAAFDTGLKTNDIVTAWQKLFAAGGALAPAGLTRIFVTHMHPDHVGMAGWLTRKFGCRLWMTRLEYLNCRVLVADTGQEAPDDAIAFYRRAGWGADALEAYRARFGSFGKFAHRLPDSYRRVVDGERIRIGGHEWQVVVGSGHSPEHACFYCAQLKLLISGDQVLPKISSNVSVFPIEPDADPMGEWLASLDKLRREVPDDVLVLPAHNEPFRGLHARLERLKTSQHAALDRLSAVLDTPKRAIDVFEQLFSRPIGEDQQLLGMATGESVSHLNYLLWRDKIVREIDAHGVAWYRNR